MKNPSKLPCSINLQLLKMLEWWWSKLCGSLDKVHCRDPQKWSSDDGGGVHVDRSRSVSHRCHSSLVAGYDLSCSTGSPQQSKPSLFDAVRLPKHRCPLPTGKPQGVSSLPETLRVSTLPPQHLGDNTTSRRKDGEHLGSKALLTLTSKTGGGGAPAEGHTDDVSVQSQESLRWEAALEDPQAEERRLELYRADRRQRYISHRDRLCWGKCSTQAETKSGNVRRVE